MKFIRAFIITTMIFSSIGGISQEVDGFIIKALEVHNLSGPDIEWQVIRQHISSTSGIQHIYFQQLFDGVVIRGTESSIHISSNGNILSESNQFVADISEVIAQKQLDVISPKKALETVITNLDYHPTNELQLLEAFDPKGNRAVFNGAGISHREIPIVMTYVQNENHSYSLVWEVTILELDYQRFMTYQVDVKTGQILKGEDFMLRCLTDDVTSQEPELNYNLNAYAPSNVTTSSKEPADCNVCYEVFARPFASPYDGDRTIVQEPADLIASPFGWHDTNGETGPESFLTEGNNSSVSEEGDNRGHRAFGGEQLDFTGFLFQPVYTIENQSEDAALTNVFYWNNVVHDITYHHGFDELSNNFQIRNYYSSGPNNDNLETRIQAARVCNAFYVSGDGGNGPITILSICESTDAAFDATVIIHEYGHGIVERLVGDSSTCLLNDEQMTEGWADYFGVLLTMSEDDLSGDRRPVANYFFGQGPNGRGIRRYPYSADFNQNPQTYGSLDNSSKPHGVGSVWASMLWEMTWALIDRHGFDSNLYNFTGDINQDAGNVMALAIVIEAMKLTKCQPGFVDAREAVLTANAQIYGLDNQCTVFNAFAKRGLGLRANQGSSESKEDGVEDFEVYPSTAQIEEISTTCFVEGINTGFMGGVPRGGVYSGIGIIDDGNGFSFSIDTSISGEGILLLKYEIDDSFCTTASIAERELDIFLDKTAPEVNCPEKIEFTVPFGEPFVLPNFRLENFFTDFCSEALILAQEPLEFTELSEGVHSIAIMATDMAGNTAECVFLLEVIWTEGPKPPFISSVLIYPVPVNDELTVYNPSGKSILSILIQDIHGRLIQVLNPSSKELRIPVDATQISAGTYFVTIVGAENTVVKRMIKI